MKAGFLDSGGGGKKNNKHGIQATGKKKNNTNGVDNTIGSCGFGLVSGFLPLVDVTGTIHVQEGDLKDGTSLMGGGMGQFSSNNPSNTGSFPITISPTPNEAGIDDVMKEVPTSYANKLSPTPMIHEFSSNEDVDSVLEDVWVKFHDILLVAYTSDGLSLIALNPNDADSFTNSMCLESWGRSNYARILIKIDACNGFSDNLVIVVPNIKGSGYTKETIRVEYEWEPPRKGGSSGADDDGFIKVKNKKSSGNNGGTKNFRPISMKQMPRYRLKPTREASPKMDPPASMKKVSIPGNSYKKIIQTNASTSGNGTFSLSNSFEVLNANSSIAADVDSGDRIVMSSVKKEGQSSTPLIENINLVEQRLLDWKCVLLDDEDKLVKRIDYTSDHDSDDEVESVDNDMARFLASNPSRALYGTNSLLE
ncbi:hypothetical protein Tco_1137572 [Tanacetum coccineum]